MIFILKKFFWDFWDNLIWGTVANFLIILPVTILFNVNVFFIPQEVLEGTVELLTFDFMTISFLVLVFVGFFWALLALGGIHLYTKDIALEGKPSKKTFLSHLAKGWIDILQWALLIFGFNAMAYSSYVWYMQNLPPDFALAAAGALILTILFLNLFFQFFLAYKTQRGTGFWRTLKETFLFVVDNLLFSFLVLLGVVPLVLVSVFSGGLIVGPFGLFLWFQSTLGLRMKKYNYLYGDSTPVRGEEKTKIPWMQLWEKERATLERRNWKSVFMPWKD